MHFCVYEVCFCLCVEGLEWLGVFVSHHFVRKKSLENVVAQITEAEDENKNEINQENILLDNN